MKREVETAPLVWRVTHPRPHFVALVRVLVNRDRPSFAVFQYGHERRFAAHEDAMMPGLRTDRFALESGGAPV
jgi:hypothetical protein